MKSSLKGGFAFVIFLSLLLQNSAASNGGSESVTEIAEELLCVLYVEGNVAYGRLREALAVLRTVRRQISAVRKQFDAQPAILGAIESLLALKSEQMAQGDKTMKSLIGHLKQVKNALFVALERGVDACGEHASQSLISSTKTSLATDLLSGYLEHNFGTAGASEGAISHAAVIKVLKTGAFLMVMLSTTADVCVITGPVICFALYVAGSGALVIWFTQIYQAMFGYDKMGESS